MHRVLQVLVPLMAVLALVWIWLDAIKLPEALETRALHSTMAVLATLLIAYVAWVLCQLAIDRNLQGVGAGPKLPGTDDDNESAPGSRLQTMLPLLRAAFGILVGVIAALIVLSRLGIDTAPLIAGAGVFGLAIGEAKIGNLRRPEKGNVSGLFAATRTGGCGDCRGFGTTLRSRARKNFPSKEKGSFVQASTMKSNASSNRSRLSSRGMP
jgi:hypothetical protein